MKPRRSKSFIDGSFSLRTRASNLRSKPRRNTSVITPATASVAIPRPQHSSLVPYTISPIFGDRLMFLIETSATNLSPSRKTIGSLRRPRTCRDPSPFSSYLHRRPGRACSLTVVRHPSACMHRQCATDNSRPSIFPQDEYAEAAWYSPRRRIPGQLQLRQLRFPRTGGGCARRDSDPLSVAAQREISHYPRPAARFRGDLTVGETQGKVRDWA